MSTAGKVLVVLVTLSLVLWLGLLAKVTRLNDMGAELYKNQANEITSLEEKYKQTDASNDALKRTIASIQDVTDEEVVRLRTESNDRENQLTASREQLDRANRELETQTSALKTAEGVAKIRNQEKAQTKKDIADTEAAVEKMKGEIAEQRKKHEQLAQEFSKLRDENLRMIRRVSR